MREQHLDLLPLTARSDVGISGGDIAGHVASAFMDRTQDLAGWSVRTADGLQAAVVAVQLAGAIAQEAPVIDAVPGRGEVAAILPELLAPRTGVEVASVIVGEVGPLEGAVAALGLIEDRDVRLDPALMHQPAQHLGRTVGGVGGQPLRVEVEAVVGALDHRTCRADLGLADGAARLDIDDDGMSMSIR